MTKHRRPFFDELKHWLSRTWQPLAAYYAMSVFGLLCLAFSILAAEPTGAASIVIGGIALGALLGQAVGNVAALFRLRIWLMILIVSGGCYLQIVSATAALAIPLVGAAWLVFPVGALSGFLVVRKRMALVGALGPVMYGVGGAIVWINTHGRVGVWQGGAKWAVWDPITFVMFGGTLLFYVVFLVTRQSQIMSLWQDAARSTTRAAVARKRAARVSWQTWGCVGLIALMLAGATAVAAPFLFRTAPAEEGSGGGGNGDQQGNNGERNNSGKGSDGKGDGKSDGRNGGEGRDGDGRRSDGGQGNRDGTGGGGQDSDDKFDAPDPNWDNVEDGARKFADQSLNLLQLLLIALLVAAAIYFIFWRPLKRLAVLRHLERPAWPVPATRRIQDQWRRLVVALQDIGIDPMRTETAEALAGRAEKELTQRFGKRPTGLAEAAAIYTRVQYNIGLQPEDATNMAAAVELVTDYIEDHLPWTTTIANLYSGRNGADYG